MELELNEIEDLEEGRLYKVVQITINGRPLLYFAKDTGKIFHFMVLKKILENHRIPYSEIKIQDYKAPDTKGETAGGVYFINGMGGAKVLPGRKVLLFGDSMGYGLNISNEHLAHFREAHPDCGWQLLSASTT